MTADRRRKDILDMLHRASAPVSASTLAAELSVSRQVIVGDIALLRAAGAPVFATPRGYVLTEKENRGERRTVACRHNAADMEAELCIMVDNGCTVEDVTVEHPVYGQITARLDVSSRWDVKQFVERVASEEARPLSALTDGVHLHTLICPDPAAFERTVRQLDEAGFLMKD